MAKVFFELDCDSCGSEWELKGTDEGMPNQPIYCPFCGHDLDLSDLEEEEYQFGDIDDDQMGLFDDFDE